jgi:transposase
MFKTASFEQELMQSMSEKLVENQTENQYSYNKIAKAADYLNAAAELFDDTGLHKQAEVITQLLESLAQVNSNPPAQDFPSIPSMWGTDKGTKTPVDPKYMKQLEQAQMKEEKQYTDNVETTRPTQTAKVKDLSSLPPKLLPTFLTPYFPGNNPVMAAVKSKLSKIPVSNLQAVKNLIQQSKLAPMQKDQLTAYVSSPVDTTYIPSTSGISASKSEKETQVNYIPPTKSETPFTSGYVKKK